MKNNRREVIAMTASTLGSTAFAGSSSATGKAPKGTVLVVGSNATVLHLQGGRAVATGNYLNETVVPMQALREAGYDLVVATPDGTRPPLDQRSVGVHHFGGDEAAFGRALSFYDDDPAFQNVRTLKSVVEAGLERYAGVYVPGGHAPITDLVANAELGEILRYAHTHDKPTALLCHGPIAMLAALREATVFEAVMIAGNRSGAVTAAKGWQYKGYRMTIFSNSEEAPVVRDVFKSPLMYSVADALTLAGGLVEQGPVDFGPHVVIDRELITGQNPQSDHDLAAKLVVALNEGVTRRASF